MINFAKRIWNDPVWSKVIATFIIFIGGLFLLYISPLWQNIQAFLASTIFYLLSTTLVANWLLLLMSVCLIVVTLVLVIIIWQILFPSTSKNAQLNWKLNYKEDLFFNVRWRWNYSANNQVISLTTYCPACDLQIYLKNRNGFTAAPMISFFCEICNKESSMFSGTCGELEDKVERYIHQKIRKNTWSNIS